MKKDLLHRLILSCKEASLLIEKKQSAKISPLKAIQLKLHLTICDACRLYKKQSKIIEEMLKKALHKKKQLEPLDEAVKQKIIEKFKK